MLSPCQGNFGHQFFIGLSEAKSLIDNNRQQNFN